VTTSSSRPGSRAPERGTRRRAALLVLLLAALLLTGPLTPPAAASAAPVAQPTPAPSTPADPLGPPEESPLGRAAPGLALIIAGLVVLIVVRVAGGDRDTGGGERRRGS
jgi:hypothetical protein